MSLTIWNCQVTLIIPFWFSSPSTEEPMETSSASQVIIIIMVILLLLLLPPPPPPPPLLLLLLLLIVITIIAVCSSTKNKYTLYYSHLLKVLDIPMEHKLNFKLKRIKCPDSWNNEMYNFA